MHIYRVVVVSDSNQALDFIRFGESKGIYFTISGDGVPVNVPPVILSELFKIL